MKRKLPLFLGALLILVSLGLVMVSQIRLHLGGQNSQQAVSGLEALLPDRTPGVPGEPAGMPVLELEGTDYVAILEVPSFGITLPVVAQWDDSRLSHAPARFYGSTGDHSLVIGGADDRRQFGFCDKIDLGDRITVTDMTGAQFTYTVSDVDRAKHADAQWLTTADCDLTLFCHDLYSMQYIAVRCTFAYS
jgi:sortase A